MRGLWPTVLGGALAALGAAVAAADLRCGGVDIEAGAEHPALAERLCRIAEESVAALSACNLDVPLPLRVDVRPQLEPGCLGLYHCGAAGIDVLDPDAFALAVTGEGPFAAIPLEHHYDSILIHELGHAAYDDRNCPFATCPVAQEVIAFAMQVRSLSEADRESFEAWGLVEPSEAQAYLTATMLALSPERFAAAAWWHVSRQEAPCAYIGAIVAGDVLLDRKWQ